MDSIEIQKLKAALDLAMEAFEKVSDIHCQYLISDTPVSTIVDVWVGENSKRCHVCIEGDSPRQALADVMNAVQRKF